MGRREWKLFSAGNRPGRLGNGISQLIWNSVLPPAAGGGSRVGVQWPLVIHKGLFGLTVSGKRWSHILEGLQKKNKAHDGGAGWSLSLLLCHFRLFIEHRAWICTEEERTLKAVSSRCQGV